MSLMHKCDRLWEKVQLQEGQFCNTGQKAALGKNIGFRFFLYFCNLRITLILPLGEI